ncbi:MAG: isochorismatase family protein [candidate division NC10 bacterium]|nr:isochorismatase family protein [candidate division NC10 bacterium]
MATGAKFFEDALTIYRAQQFGNRVGFGERPAVIVVDLTNAGTDPAYLGGGNIGTATEHTATLLPKARAAGCPVIYSIVVYREDLRDAGTFGMKVPSVKVLQEGSKAVEIDSRVALQAGDYLIVKKAPSVFFGTNLNMLLTHLRVDTLIVTGCTTSGCVRATVVDGCSSGYRVIVPRECVGDRAPGPHEANLFDMDQKYADIVATDDVITYLGSVTGGKRRPAHP